MTDALATSPSPGRSSPPAVIVRDLAKRFSPRNTPGHLPIIAVDGVDFDIERGDMFTILGPSGCGKTTTLRCIAGLEKPNRGSVTVDGRTLVSVEDGINVPPNERGMGMVFQSYAIWPHMSVFENVAFPLTARPRSKRPGKRAIRQRVERALEMVRLDNFVKREATELSGGEQQRLALARALITEPSVLLLDEPLSNLDAKLREEMRFELKQLQHELGITTIYVTHDQVEALGMSTRVVVMNKGRVEQVGTPREIYDEPRSPFVAGFIGATNFVDGVIEADLGGAYQVKTAAGNLRAVTTLSFAVADQALVAIRPEHIELVNPAEADPDWVGVVEVQAFLGDAVDHMVQVGPLEMKVRSHTRRSVAPGSRVGLRFEDGSCSLLEPPG